jgi:peroxin-19
VNKHAHADTQYPSYLDSPPAGTNPADLEKYKQQFKIVSSILDTFQKPGYTDEKDGHEVARLVGEMQDLGGPPPEIMGDLPEGFVSRDMDLRDPSS